MQKLKENILKNVGSSNGGSSSSNSTNGGINTTNDSTSGTNDTSTNTSSGSTITNFSYIHGIGATAVLALGVCIFVIPKLMNAEKSENKKLEKTSKIRRKML